MPCWTPESNRGAAPIFDSNSGYNSYEPGTSTTLASSISQTGELPQSLTPIPATTFVSTELPQPRPLSPHSLAFEDSGHPLHSPFNHSMIFDTPPPFQNTNGWFGGLNQFQINSGYKLSMAATGFDLWTIFSI